MRARWRSTAFVGLVVCAMVLPRGGIVSRAAQQASNQLSSPADDAARVRRLTKSGTKVESERVTAWLSKDAMSASEMQDVLRRVETAVTTIETFVHVPRPWQKTRNRRVEYFFEEGPFFVPHATINRQVLMPVVRLRDGQAPILHETTHALLTPPQGHRPFAWLTEGVATYVAKAISQEKQIPEGDRFELGEIDQIDGKCAAGLSSAEGARVLPFIGAPGNLQTLYAMEPAIRMRQVFYGCSASFTKYLVDRLGLERVVDLLPDADPHATIERLASANMASVRTEWMAKIGARVP
ncbi:MAG TPA: hypothetical protein VG736_11590 [Vicinamibacterales bacterium]|jgi:hypothetical protein|nr:hypothetical protein [Vicinamibacterales bacterium]